MNRRKFIDSLRKELEKLPPEEIEAAIEYYEEYFDEAGPENEQEVLDRLGSPKKVAGQIKSEYAVRLFDDSEKKTTKKGISAVWYVILGICSAPVSIPLAIALGAVAIVLFVAVLTCIIGVMAGLIGAAVASVACVVVGIMAVPVALSTAVLFVGIGLCGLGVLAAMIVLLFIGVRAATRGLIRAVRKRNERKKIERMVNINENRKWRYADETDTAAGEAETFGRKNTAAAGEAAADGYKDEMTDSETSAFVGEERREHKYLSDNGGEDDE